MSVDVTTYFLSLKYNSCTFSNKKNKLAFLFSFLTTATYMTKHKGISPLLSVKRCSVPEFYWCIKGDITTSMITIPRHAVCLFVVYEIWQCWTSGGHVLCLTRTQLQPGKPKKRSPQHKTPTRTGHFFPPAPMNTHSDVKSTWLHQKQTEQQFLPLKDLDYIYADKCLF